MPTYTYKCSACDTKWDEIHKIAHRKDPEGLPCPSCKTNGSVSQAVTSVSFGDPVKMGLSKVSDGWRDVLKKVHSNAPGSQLDQTSTITKI